MKEMLQMEVKKELEDAKTDVNEEEPSFKDFQ